MDVNARNKQVKAILSKRFSNVRVTGGKGASWGWCKVHIDVPRPEACTCHGEGFYCQACKDAMNGKSKAAESLLTDVEFYKYSDDMNDGYKCLSIEVSIK